MLPSAALVLVLAACSSVTKAAANVEDVSTEAFDAMLKEFPYVMVLFSETGCPTCAYAQTIFASLTPLDSLPAEVKKVQMADKTVAARFGIKDFPALLFFRHALPALYDGEWEELELLEWMFQAQAPASQLLEDGNFEHLTQAATGATTGDWLVVFYRDDCASILPALEAAAIRLKQTMNAARVDLVSSPKLLERFKLSQCPSILLQGKMYLYDVSTYDAKALVSFATSWYRNLKATRVPGEITGFDRLTDFIVRELKKITAGQGKQLYIVGGVGAGLLFVLTLLLCCCCRSTPARKHKED